jgi:transglutaminase-like putative cysteine protease
VLRYRILHRTYYNFSGVATLQPHQLRLRPREDYSLRIESFNLQLTPAATLLWHRDAEGNSVAVATFDQPTRQLAIESESIVQQYNESPLDFMVAEYALAYPFSYTCDDQVLLAPYRIADRVPAENLMAQWVGNFWRAGEPIQSYSLMNQMNDYIHKTFTYQVREEPGVQSAEQTLQCGTGSCRDFALLFMEAAKYLGLAARFVSGYLYDPNSTVAGATHAWAEVYLPGAGWLGFDPTIGSIVGTDHIPVAVARLAESVPPVAGSFVGAPGSTLDVGVWVSAC